MLFRSRLYEAFFLIRPRWLSMMLRHRLKPMPKPSALVEKADLILALEKTSRQAQRAGQIIHRIRAFVKRSEHSANRRRRTASSMTQSSWRASSCAGATCRSTLTWRSACPR